MSVRIRRVVVAGVIAAATVAIPVAALASGSGSPPTKPSPVASNSAPLGKPSPVASNSAPLGKPSPVASKSAAAAASKSAAAGSGRRVDQSLTGQAAVAALAKELGVSTGAARHALEQIDAVSRQGVDPTGPAFAAIAHALGVSPAQLAAALGGVKQSLAGK